MTVAELTQDVQFTLDQQGKVTAVVIDPVLWQRIVAALEDSEDRRLVQSLQERLAQGPLASGALAWESVSNEFTVGDFRNSGLLGMWKDRVALIVGSMADGMSAGEVMCEYPQLTTADVYAALVWRDTKL